MGRRRGFTLVELLVVIGIISVLISILLPALGKARETANSLKCQANLRSIAQAMMIYCSENDGYIPGSALTTGRHLWEDSGGTFSLRAGVTNTNVPPPVIELYDYIGPLSRIMKIAVSETSGTVQRLKEYRELAAFKCPSNEGIIATRFSGPASAENGPMLSYCTGAAFMLGPFRNSSFSGRGAMPGTPYWSAPAGYVPKVTRIGPSSQKVFLADSGRWSRYNSAPAFALEADGNHNDTMFSDFGPFWGITKSFDRSVPNKVNSPEMDARIFAYRHGARSQNQPVGAYRLNVVFYDGHTDTLDDLESADPNLWLPRGSMMTHASPPPNAGGVWPDVAAKYLANVSKSNPHVVP